MARLPILFVLLAALASLAIAASPPTFCKCTCFKNSTIIPLGPGHEPPAAPPAPSPTTPTTPPSDGKDKGKAGGGAAAAAPRAHMEDKRAASSSCSQCNRAFCLKYNLPICKGAEEKDVVTMCFARDSRKDRLIVWTFLLGTAGLLGWATVRRALEQREMRKRAAAAGLGGGVDDVAGGGGGGGGGNPRRSPTRRGGADSGGDYMFVAGDDRGEGSAAGLRSGR
ncbi:hypothetical protein RB599_001656 [Gaeumannomyces hyphopodioides]